MLAQGIEIEFLDKLSLLQMLPSFIWLLGVWIAGLLLTYRVRRLHGSCGVHRHVPGSLLTLFPFTQDAPVLLPLWNSCHRSKTHEQNSSSFSGLSFPENPSPHSPWTTSPLCDTYLVSLYLIYISVPSWTGSASKDSLLFIAVSPVCSVGLFLPDPQLLCYASNHSRTDPNPTWVCSYNAGVSQRQVLEARAGGRFSSSSLTSSSVSGSSCVSNTPPASSVLHLVLCDPDPTMTASSLHPSSLGWVAASCRC